MLNDDKDSSSIAHKGGKIGRVGLGALAIFHDESAS